ncbi:hypothetical protein AB0N14_30080 [Streptomyces sp. NPDC051104]
MSGPKRVRKAAAAAVATAAAATGTAALNRQAGPARLLGGLPLRGR